MQEMLQNRAKNGLTARTALCYKTFALIRTKKQEEIAYSCQKEGGSLANKHKSTTY